MLNEKIGTKKTNTPLQRSDSPPPAWLPCLYKNWWPHWGPPRPPSCHLRPSSLPSSRRQGWHRGHARCPTAAAARWLSNGHGWAQLEGLGQFLPRVQVLTTRRYGPRELEASSGRLRRPSSGHEFGDVAESHLEMPDEITHGKDEGGILLHCHYLLVAYAGGGTTHRGLRPTGRGKGGVSHPLTEELRDRRVPQTLSSDGANPRPKKTKIAPSAPTTAADKAIKATPSPKGGVVKTLRPSRQGPAPRRGGGGDRGRQGTPSPKGGGGRDRGGQGKPHPRPQGGGVKTARVPTIPLLGPAPTSRTRAGWRWARSPVSDIGRAVSFGCNTRTTPHSTKWSDTSSLAPPRRPTHAS